MTHLDQPFKNRTVTTAAALVSEGLSDPGELETLKAVAERYAIAAPPHLLGLIEGDTTGDPIARQIIPTAAELTTTPEEHPDPIGDHPHSPVRGLVHRYPDRVLLKVHSACALYCRFCFRREMVGPGGDMMRDEDIAAALTYIESHPEIWEVILTGGDPLVMSPARLAEVLDALDQIGHVKVVRIHTRLPVAAPDRISDDMVRVLSGRRVTVYVAIHSNHARELSYEVDAACRRLTAAGIPLLGQTVLLKGVNDNASTLEDLFRAMVTLRITPYYLHHPDLAPGTSHFRLPIAEGQALMKQLRGRVSGITLPTYMLDIPGGHGKVPIGPSYVTTRRPDSLEIEDISGRTHIYPPVDNPSA